MDKSLRSPLDHRSSFKRTVRPEPNRTKLTNKIANADDNPIFAVRGDRYQSKEGAG